jgi:CHASE1-domain containing sensor protein
LLAAACAALVLTLVVLSVCPSLHAWLHGEKVLDDDDGCAVVLFVHGLVAAAVAATVLVFLRRLLGEDVRSPGIFILLASSFERPFSCGPPVG